MPYRYKYAATVCQHDGCPNIATHRGRCDRHQLVDTYQARRLSGWESGRLRRRLIAERGNACEVCGSPENLELHHRNGNPADNRESNLAIVCRRHNPRGTPTHHH